MTHVIYHDWPDSLPGPAERRKELISFFWMKTIQVPNYWTIMGSAGMRQNWSTGQQPPNCPCFWIQASILGRAPSLTHTNTTPLCLFADLLFLCNAPFGAAKLGTIQQRLSPIPPAVSTKRQALSCFPHDAQKLSKSSHPGHPGSQEVVVQQIVGIDVLPTTNLRDLIVEVEACCLRTQTPGSIVPCHLELMTWWILVAQLWPWWWCRSPI